MTVGDRFLVALYERDLKAASKTLEALPADLVFVKETAYFPKSWWEGLVAHLRGDASAARTAFTTARGEVEKVVREQPDNGYALSGLGLIDAALGNKKDAIREGEGAVALVPVTKNTIDGAMLRQYLAIIYAWVGKKDAALDQLDAATKMPGYLSYGELQVDPLWDPLRNDQRFEKIVAGLAPK